MTEYVIYFEYDILCIHVIVECLRKCISMDSGFLIVLGDFLAIILRFISIFLMHDEFKSFPCYGLEEFYK